MIDLDAELLRVRLVSAIESEIVRQDCGDLLPEPDDERLWLMRDQLDVAQLADAIMRSLPKSQCG